MYIKLMQFLDYFAIFSNKNDMICKQNKSQSYKKFKKKLEKIQNSYNKFTVYNNFLLSSWTLRQKKVNYGFE